MNGPAEDRATAQRAEIHVGLSDHVLTELAVRSAHIPTQRAGSAYETTVLQTHADDTLSDLSDLVYIPSLRGFVKEVSGGQDVPQTADHAAGGDPR